MWIDTINSTIPSDWSCTSWCAIFSPSDSHALKERTTKTRNSKSSCIPPKRVILKQLIV